jgi:hypothetical protein
MAVIMGWSLLVNYCTAAANNAERNNIREAVYTGSKERSAI